jgi:pimeloyl-ACP methyl ester carboxylesterase
MPTVRMSAGTVSYEDFGTGEPVVLLHANLHDRHDYDAVVALLGLGHEGYRMIALDWPGHGESPRPASGEPITAQFLAEVLAEFVAALDLEQAVYVGNSVGGFAAARLAIDQPDRVAGLVLVNSGGLTARGVTTRIGARVLGTPALNRRIYPRLVQRYMSPRGAEDARIADEVRQRAMTAEGAKTSAELFRSFAEASYDLRAEAGRIVAPTLIAWGMRDVVLPPSTARQTRSALPGAVLHTFDTGHVVFASDPEGFVRTVRPFLDGVYERSRA